MSFTWPFALAGLLLVPLGARSATALVQRRRTRYAVRFTNLDLLASVVDKTPAWRRHVPAALALLALTALVLAVARPTMAMEVAQDQSTVVLTVDVSGSMAAEDVAPTRIEAARQAANAFLDEVPEGVKVGLVSFSDGANVEIAPTTDLDSVAPPSTGSSPAAAPPSATPSPAPPTWPARACRRRSSPRTPRPRAPPAVVLLLSDGANSTGPSTRRPARRSPRRTACPIHTVALGTPDRHRRDRPGRQWRADHPGAARSRRRSSRSRPTTGGQFFDAPDAGS